MNIYSWVWWEGREESNDCDRFKVKGKKLSVNFLILISLFGDKVISYEYRGDDLKTWNHGRFRTASYGKCNWDE